MEKKDKTDRNRRFTFNVHNYQEKGYSSQKLLEEFTNSWKVDYMIVGEEITEENKIPHLQGYIEFSNATTWEQVRHRFISTIGYVSDLALSKADGLSNQKYCSKGNNVVEYGILNKRQAVEDTSSNVISLITQGYDLIEIMAMNKLLCPYIIRNYTNLFKIYTDIRSSRKIEPVEEKDLPF
jgi:hypothetical protein